MGKRLVVAAFTEYRHEPQLREVHHPIAACEALALKLADGDCKYIYIFTR